MTERKIEHLHGEEECDGGAACPDVVEEQALEQDETAREPEPVRDGRNDPPPIVTPPLPGEQPVDPAPAGSFDSLNPHR